ncbi:hypothetical protein HMPREF9072_02440 [Capnocytophaga sp. oral taxon 324 str. F0483]|nr:hypothetical protein HMPREF9072_02440 [Capnocytophaga sp. oral taxon 324 str. F0483]
MVLCLRGRTVQKGVEFSEDIGEVRKKGGRVFDEKRLLEGWG